MAPATVVAGVVLMVVVAAAADMIWGARRLASLDRVVPRDAASCPPVSIVVAARDEVDQLDPALRSLLAQDLTELEVILVDDRSGDGTGAHAQTIRHGDRRCRVVRVDELPAGWLGKNHALQVGALHARGEVLLFTDADVVMTPDAVRRALGLLLADDLDHLAVTPKIIARTPLVSLFTAAFPLYFGIYARPWAADRPRSAAHVGIGAFNLVRRSAWEAIGGHRAVAMRPDDDLRLGRALKAAGFRQRLAIGHTHVAVEWYPSFGAICDGLVKNAFAAVDYSLPRFVVSVLAQLVVNLSPWLAPWFVSGPARWLFATAAGIMVAVAAISTRTSGAPVIAALGLPLGSVLMLVVQIQATVRNLVSGGIRWRGSFYPLAELRNPPAAASVAIDEPPVQPPSSR